ncbi:Phosphatidylinositol N-acetylglucosaminyltransferase subunit Y [Myotis davidii]|uniref:Phosphatidylinositol N-acetylglucosaminyltransferase subunit Y n=1 Tax=Myotis davidii TaxID=225400 RepID=L5LKQ1_MYODS|nr:Phosphatidylinositol N-acetylglucosaminyltransferase subunit Y [Myotis davidii]
MFLSLPTLTVLIPLISLAGLFYSASVEEDFPQGCTSTASLCFYSLLLPITIPVCYWNCYFLQVPPGGTFGSPMEPLTAAPAKC